MYFNVSEDSLPALSLSRPFPVGKMQGKNYIQLRTFFAPISKEFALIG